MGSWEITLLAALEFGYHVGICLAILKVFWFR